ncbi:MAG: hypothetical protein F6J87_22970 [Spirulina sp. SIO3F2]|nr:hypothetical protein [Spirulina sp. SIO3F2]
MTSFLLRCLAGVGLVSMLAGCQGPRQQATPVKAQSTLDQLSESAPERDRSDITIPSEYRKILGEGVSIYLPEGYEGGDPKQDIEQVAEQLEAAGEEHKDLSKALRKSKQRVALIAFDGQSDEEGFVTNVNISLREAVPGTPLSVFLKTMTVNLTGQGYAIAAQSTPTLNGQEVGRLIVDVTVGKVELTQLVYVFKGETGFWLVTYSTTADEFEDRLSEFEQSVLTFNPTTTAAQL